jgi:hypothetical protein
MNNIEIKNTQRPFRIFKIRMVFSAQKGYGPDKLKSNRGKNYLSRFVSYITTYYLLNPYQTLKCVEFGWKELIYISLVKTKTYRADR